MKLQTEPRSITAVFRQHSPFLSSKLEENITLLFEERLPSALTLKINIDPSSQILGYNDKQRLFIVPVILVTFSFDDMGYQIDQNL